MPLREYICEKCGIIEELHKNSLEKLETCPHCNQKVILKISGCNFSFTGSGFYKTDYKTNKKGKKNEN